jgi:hypothetical protein
LLFIYFLTSPFLYVLFLNILVYSKLDFQNIHDKL